MAEETISHDEEIKILNKLMNSKLAWTLLVILITGPSTWLIAGSSFNDKVDTVIKQNAMEHFEDSLQNAYLIERNNMLINTLQTYGQAIINLDSTVQRMNQHIEYMQNDINYVRNRIDK